MRWRVTCGDKHDIDMVKMSMTVLHTVENTQIRPRRGLWSRVHSGATGFSAPFLRPLRPRSGAAGGRTPLRGEAETGRDGRRRSSASRSVSQPSAGINTGAPPVFVCG